MKQLKAEQITLESVIQDYTLNDDGKTHRIVFNIKPEEKMRLINLGFRGDETIIRITKYRQSNLLDFRLWYSDEKSFSWTTGSSSTLVSGTTVLMGKQIQQLAEKITHKSFDPYSRD